MLVEAQLGWYWHFGRTPVSVNSPEGREIHSPVITGPVRNRPGDLPVPEPAREVVKSLVCMNVDA